LWATNIKISNIWSRSAPYIASTTDVLKYFCEFVTNPPGGDDDDDHRRWLKPLKDEILSQREKTSPPPQRISLQPSEVGCYLAFELCNQFQ
jgi:hypothetical protein